MVMFVLFLFLSGLLVCGMTQIDTSFLLLKFNVLEMLDVGFSIFLPIVEEL